MKINDLQKIIEEKNFDALLGQPEDENFECKGEPYNVSIEKGKRELAKDISSFANGNGGYVFIGLKTKKSLFHSVDKVDIIKPFSEALLNSSQYHDILRYWVYPEIENIDIRWIKANKNKDKGIVIITIPKQKETNKPFLITKTLDENKNKKVEIIFGYSIRKRDTTQSLSVHDLQKNISIGLHYKQNLENKLEDIKSLVEYIAGGNRSQIENDTMGDFLEERQDDALAHENLRNERVMIFSAFLKEPNELKSLFSSDEKSIRKKLEKPPELRHGGWSLGTLDAAKIIRGEKIRVTNGSRKVIDLYKDGNLIFVGLANSRFFAHADQGSNRLNPVAIIEAMYCFLNFFKLVLEDLEKPAKEFTVRIDFRNFHLNGKKNFLNPYEIDSMAYLFNDEAKQAPDNNGYIEKTFLAENFDAAQVGYELIKKIYLWFGIEEDKIPYIKRDEGLKRIDISRISSM